MYRVAEMRSPRLLISRAVLTQLKMVYWGTVNTVSAVANAFGPYFGAGAGVVLMMGLSVLGAGWGIWTCSVMLTGASVRGASCFGRRRVCVCR